MATSATKQFKMANVQIKFEIGGTNCLAGERYIVRRMTEKVVDEVSVERNMVMETDVPSLDKME